MVVKLELKRLPYIIVVWLEVMSEFVFNKKRGVWTGLFLRMMQVICVKVEK